MTQRKQNHKKKRNKTRAPSTPYTLDLEEQRFVDALNIYRKDSGAKALNVNARLGKAARHHAEDMAEHNYVGHYLFRGESDAKNIEAYGYLYTEYGGVIFAGDGDGVHALTNLKTSPPHDEKMRKGVFDDVGVGRAYGANTEHGWYWCIYLGKRD
jgi:uncharacterized protein YkwD